MKPDHFCVVCLRSTLLMMMVSVVVNSMIKISSAERSAYFQAFEGDYNRSLITLLGTVSGATELLFKYQSG